MGGRALISIGVATRRVSADEYHGFIVPKVMAGLVRALPGLRAEPVQAYRDKPDFGDMDVVIDKDTLPDGWRERVIREFNPTATVTNGPVFSLDVEAVQIDLISHRSSVYDFARRYYAWNDLGNFMGRVARGMGFKLGHDGLWLLVSDTDNPSHRLEALSVTQDYDEAIGFLGYDSGRYHQGFSSLKDVFAYAVSTPNFRHDWIRLENRNNKSRVRDAKRASYQAFLTWLDKEWRGAPTNEPVDKAACLSAAYHLFNGLAAKHDSILAYGRATKAFKERFNGNVVADMTGLSGKPLGQRMAAIVHEAGGKDKFMTDLSTMTAAEADKRIQLLSEAAVSPSTGIGPPQVSP